MQTPQKSDEAYQAPTSAIEKALEKWALRVYAQKSYVAQVEGSDGLGSTWLRGFLNQHPALSARFASATDRKSAHENALEATKGRFRKLRDVVRFKIKKIYGIWMKMAHTSCCQPCKVIASTGRRPPLLRSKTENADSDSCLQGFCPLSWLVYGGYQGYTWSLCLRSKGIQHK